MRQNKLLRRAKIPNKLHPKLTDGGFPFAYRDPSIGFPSFVTHMFSGSFAFASNRRAIAIGAPYLAALLLLLVVALFHLGTGHPIAEFTRDPAALMDRSPLVGCLSTLGIFLWTSGAAVALFTASVLPHGQRPRGLLATLAALTALLLVDDVFMLHEYLGPRHLGLPEEVFLGFYAAIGLTTLLFFHRSWLLMPIGAFLGASLLLGGSVAADLLITDSFQSANPNLSFFIEDGLKLLGIVGWTTALVWSSARSLTSARSHRVTRINAMQAAPDEKEPSVTAPSFLSRPSHIREVQDHRSS